MTAHGSEGTFRVLVVDDNEVIHDDFRKILCSTEDAGAVEKLEAQLFGATCRNATISFSVDGALQGAEGLEKTRQSLQEGRPFAVAFVDMRMPPGWDGLTTIEKLWEVDPTLQVVICTAYSEYPWEAIIQRLGSTDRLLILKKPFDAIEVRQLANALCVKWHLARQAALKMDLLEELVRNRTRELQARQDDLQKEMAQRKELESQLLQVQKLDAVGRLAGGIAHDFNNQLFVVLGYAEMLVNRLDDSVLRRYAENIMRATHRSADLTQQLLAFARKGKYRSVPTDMHRVIRDAGEMLQHTIDKRIAIEIHLDAASAMITGDPNQMQNTLLNLALNARDAMPSGGKLTFTTSLAVVREQSPALGLSAGRYFEVRVADTGVGMDDDTQAHLFEPFFTTKAPGDGTGLGLAAVYGAVKNHGGAINVSSRPGEGTTFVIHLPLLEETSAAASGLQPAEAPLRGSGCILVVDDEEMAREMLAETLAGVGYTVITCADGAEATKVYRERWREVDVVLLDIVMPNMGGLETYTELRVVNPAIKAIVCSGHSMDGEAQRILEMGAMGFIQKPIDTATLSRAIAKILTR